MDLGPHFEASTEHVNPLAKFQYSSYNWKLIKIIINREMFHFHQSLDHEKSDLFQC
jgi:hypothetical protein